MTKELYMDAHESLIMEMMERYPNMPWQEACDRTADQDRMKENLADMADRLRKEND